MAIRESELRLLLPELAESLIGRPLSNVWQPTRQSVVLGFASGSMLLLVPRGPDARIHTIGRRPKNPPQPFSFQGACRAHLQGPLTRLEQIDGDRVVELGFGDHHLHLRLTGHRGGLWLVRDDLVLAAYDGPALPTLPVLEPGGDRELPPRMQPAEHGWDRAIAVYYGRRIAERRENELRVLVERWLRKEIARLARLAQNLDDDLRRADRADEVRGLADTLAAHLHEVVPGADHVDLPSYDDPTVALRVPLLVGKSASVSLAALYKKAKRLDRMGDAVLERIEITERRLGQLRTQLEGLANLDLAALETLEGQVRPRGAQGDQVALPGVTRWTGPNLETVLVGRDEKANRKLSFQVGRGGDWWMHQRGKPGAHVLIKLQKDRTPSLDLLLAAAQIVAVHAGVPDGQRCEVQYTRIRDIRSIPGTVASVRVHNEKVLEVVRDPQVLTGWLRS